VLYPRKCFGILQFYISLAGLYKIICLQFFICILLSVLLFYVFVSLPQSVLYDILLLKTLRVHAPDSRNPWFLQLASVVIVSRTDQGVEQAGALDLAASKGSDKPVV